MTRIAVWKVEHGEVTDRIVTWGQVARWCRGQVPTPKARCLGCGTEMDSGAMLCSDCGVHIHVGDPL